jgi:signal transduction histidine kinase
LLHDILGTYPDLSARRDSIHLDGTLPTVIGNEAALTQCFSNLLANALKFAQPGRPVQVRVWAEDRGRQVRLHFEDNGIGIPEELHERIFELFQRASDSGEGTGIGLPIVKKSVERMGGKVGVVSTPGVGSTFWLELNRPQAGKGQE